jgi:outer membrane protein OmpA-like peptidoglycan-associated protein
MSGRAPVSMRAALAVFPLLLAVSAADRLPEPTPRPTGEIQSPGEIQHPRGQWQKPGDIQQPKGTWQQPGEFQKPGEIQSVKEHCHLRLRVGSDALFEFDKATLTAAAEKSLSGLPALIAQAGRHPVSVEGHTDAIGDDRYNQTLSEKRAAAVRDWLAAHGAVPAGTPVKGYGKRKPVAPNRKPDGSDDPEGRARNRRVEVLIDTCR